MASRATIKVLPHQHIPPEIVKVTVEVNFDVPDEGPCPNDVHILIRRLSAFNGDWHQVINTSYHYGVMPLPLTVTPFDKPKEKGTYDVRVVFTLDDEPIKEGERTGQFFVD